MAMDAILKQRALSKAQQKLSQEKGVELYAEGKQGNPNQALGADQALEKDGSENSEHASLSANPQIVGGCIGKGLMIKDGEKISFVSKIVCHDFEGNPLNPDGTLITTDPQALESSAVSNEDTAELTGGGTDVLDMSHSTEF